MCTCPFSSVFCDNDSLGNPSQPSWIPCKLMQTFHSRRFLAQLPDGKGHLVICWQSSCFRAMPDKLILQRAQTVYKIVQNRPHDRKNTSAIFLHFVLSPKQHHRECSIFHWSCCYFYITNFFLNKYCIFLLLWLTFVDSLSFVKLFHHYNFTVTIFKAEFVFQFRVGMFHC